MVGKDIFMPCKSRHIMSCQISLCHVMSHCIISYVLSCHIMPCHATPWQVTSHHVTLCHAMLCHVIVLCHDVMSWCYLMMPWHVMLCHVMMSCQVTYSAASLLVCNHSPSIHYTVRTSEIVMTLQAHVLVVVLTQTNVGHGVCIKHNIRINTILN